MQKISAMIIIVIGVFTLSYAILNFVYNHQNADMFFWMGTSTVEVIIGSHFMQSIEAKETKDNP